MKNVFLKFLAVSFVWLALTVGVRAGDIYFSVAQNADGSHLESIGDLASDNPNAYTSADGVTAPATSVQMWFFSPLGNCLFVASVDSSAAKGTYNIGYFSGGGTCYVSIY